MPYYRVRFRIPKKGEIEYPDSVSSIEWDRIVYNELDTEFVGRTRKRMDSTEDDVVELKEKEALELMKEFISNYPKIQEVETLLDLDHPKIKKWITNEDK